MLNFSGLLGFGLSAAFKQQLITPSHRIRDIRDCDWHALKRLGFNALVIDKDNCITLPYQDSLIDELRPAWTSALKTFGSGNVIVVSNSAGAGPDRELVQAEAVASQLSAPVLVHHHPKPAHSVVSALEAYLGVGPADAVARVVLPRGSTSLPPRPSDVVPRLLVVGDRISTDIILAGRLRSRLGPQAVVLGVLTDRIWVPESLGTRALRWIEERATGVPSTYSPFKSCFHPATMKNNLQHPLPRLDPSPASSPLRPFELLQARIKDTLISYRGQIVNSLLRLLRRQGTRLRLFYAESCGLGFQVPRELSRLRVWKGRSYER